MKALKWEDCQPKGIVITVKCRNSSRVRKFNSITTSEKLKNVFQDK